MTVKIGIQTLSLRRPLRQALVLASRLGAEGVEIDARHQLRPSDLSRTGLTEFHKLLGDLNLRVSAVAFPTRNGYDEAEGLERRVLATQEAMRFAADLRTDVVINQIGRVAEKSEDPSFQRLIEALTAIAAFGDRAGVRLAAQTANLNPQDLARVLAALPEHSTGVDLYPTGLIVAGYSPVDAIESLGPHVLHIHACDAVRDPASRRATEVELGRGSANFPELLGYLSEFNYRGWATIERKETSDPVPEIENAVAYLQSLESTEEVTMARPVTVTIPHTLGKAEARKRIEEGFGKLRQQMLGGVAGMLGKMITIQDRWEGDQLHFEGGGLGQKMTGRLDVRDNAVEIQLDLPEMLAALADKIKTSLKTEGQKLLEKK